MLEEASVEIPRSSSLSILLHLASMNLDVNMRQFLFACNKQSVVKKENHKLNDRSFIAQQKFMRKK